MISINRTTSITVVAVLVAALVGALVFAGPAAAVSAFTFTADNSDNAVHTNHTVSLDSDAESGDVKHVEVRYTESDVSDVTADDVTVTAGGASQTISSIDVSDPNTLNVTLGTAYTLDSAASDVVEVATSNDTVENPQNAGDYTVELALVDGTGTDITSLSGTFTVTQGPTPSVNATNSDLYQGAALADYNGSETKNVTIQTEAWTNNQKLRLTDGGNTTYETFSNVTTVSSATSTSPGTYEFQLTQADLRSVPMTINENASVHAEVVNTSASSAPVNNFDSEIQNGDEVSQIAVSHDAINDSAIGPDVEFESADEGPLSFLSLSNDDDYTVSDERSINGSDSTLYVTFVDDSAATSFEEAGTRFTDASEVGAGEWMVGQSVFLDDGRGVAVYKNGVGDLHANGSSYAVYHEDRDQLEVQLGDRYDGQKAADITAENDPMGLTTRIKVNRLGSELSDLDEDNEGFLGMTAPVLVTGVAAKRRDTVGPDA